MKQKYLTPETDLLEFKLTDVVSTSIGINALGNEDFSDPVDLGGSWE